LRKSTQFDFAFVFKLFLKTALIGVDLRLKDLDFYFKA